MDKVTAILIGAGAAIASMFAFLWRKKEREVARANTRAEDAEAKHLEAEAIEAARKSLTSKERYEADRKALRDATATELSDPGKRD